MIDAATQTLAQRGSRPLPANQEACPLADLRGLVVEWANLVYDETGWTRQLWRQVRHLGHSCDYAQFQHVWSRQYLVEVQRGRREHGEALEAFLQAQRLSWGEIDEVVAAGRGHDDWASDSRPLPGVGKTLAALATGDVAVLVWADSHLPASRLTQRLEADGLGSTARCLSSFDLGATLPADDCFHACLEALGLPAAAVLYVGHDAVNLAAARRQGLATAAFNGEPSVQADLYLGRFEDLLPTVIATSHSHFALHRRAS